MEGFHAAVDGLNFKGDAWRLACQRAGRLIHVSPQIQDAFLNVWITSKMLPLRVGNRSVMAAALRVLLPRNYNGGPLELFRGATNLERSRRLYGFAWTTRQSIAKKFAQHWGQFDEGGVVLRTVAPAPAVLLVREEGDDYDEAEVIIDPYLLTQVSVVERLPMSSARTC